MPRKRPRKAAVQDALRKIPPDRAGLPAPEHVEDVETFVAPDQQEYQILKTSETDEYDEPLPPKRRKPKTG